ncbi:DnaD domain-containing protein [Bacillus sp. UMB0893]|uniref:DnaD domain-containing protein n=1 Tax=Bacillus sp. UMB0893 TaxID=2066053 RepID=UPI000C774525|nr:DnaD domain protein [Bacillus sp. UMB0893]PLR66293.1 hypothetical protein CYJ36_19565 [Bacillus sp. UMB0893]
MRSNLLISEHSMMVQPSLAKQVGLKESIILQQFHYWLQKSAITIDSEKWICYTHEGLHKQFPFLSMITIRRTLLKLEKQKLIIVSIHKKQFGPQTKRYRINYEVLDKMINDTQQNNHTGNIDRKMNSIGEQNDQLPVTNRADVMITIREQYDQDSRTKRSEPIDKLITMKEQNDHDPCTKRSAKKDKVSSSILNNTNNTKRKENRIIVFFEENGFGECKPYIAERIRNWQSIFDDTIIIEALKTAISYHAITWKYADTVLANWKSANIQTLQDVWDLQERRRTKRYQPKLIRKEPVPEWLVENSYENPPKDQSDEDINVLRDRIERYMNREDEDAAFESFV